NGRPEAVEAVYLMKTPEEWDRFMRFMNRYAEENDLGLSKS
ncbi:MAG: photosystem II reaction center protein Psb28, partial [Sphaerospermopsis kisseleviana]